VEIYAISVDSAEDSRPLRQRLGIQYPFLSDPRRSVIDLLEIRYRRLNPSGGDIAIPTLILADRDGIIHWIHQTEDYRVRARPEEILGILDRRE
jgi:peroxiredoxin